MKEYLKLIRVKHWLKNGLVFLPLFFSINLFNNQYYLNAILSFIVFSFFSSIVYVINDISDIEKDKLHPIKKKRPLAAGTISIKQAYVVISILALLSVVLIVSSTETKELSPPKVRINLSPFSVFILS